MTSASGKVTIHMVSSLDGYIANKTNSISWMDSDDCYEKGIRMEDVDVDAFLSEIDCYVLGGKTYEHALTLGWPYGDVPTFVLTHKELPAIRPSVKFHSGDLASFVNGQLKPNYKNIWMGGGSALARDFIRLELADDIRITIAPVLLGDGIPFFDHVGGELRLHLKEVSTHRNGMVELWYEILK
jgi:dihydrofolate reductase